MEESARKSAWDVNAKEASPAPPFEIAIVFDLQEAEKKRNVSDAVSPILHSVMNSAKSGIAHLGDELVNHAVIRVQELGGDPVRHLSTALSNAGLVVEQNEGANHLMYLKVAAPLEVVGRASEKLRLRKPTNVGMAPTKPLNHGFLKWNDPWS